MKALRFILPAVVFAVIAWFLLAGLDRNPRDIPSPLIGKPAPDFSLPVTHDLARTWSPQALRGKVWLLNVWGSWCSACQVEHPVLNDLARSGEIPIVGLAWKDMPENSIAWLRRLGNPYSVVVSDVQGRVGIDYGVYGAPETFLIDGAGIIRYKHVGPVTPELLQQKLLPLARELAAS
ncbi:MAG: DsbE family thiol:disulfide interchange protein [Burkholderiaceae bacterium]|nr:DsbE family thiol:disulfide interchange protein [Burkholderiaceae bacterium]MCD6673370.1 DsbE family thiol:disulfide interchange protein [Burkholderiaceae bacterium]